MQPQLLIDGLSGAQYLARARAHLLKQPGQRWPVQGIDVVVDAFGVDAARLQEGDGLPTFASRGLFIERNTHDASFQGYG
jgi:hypothetical protein